jgi:hypothetical protein
MLSIQQFKIVLFPQLPWTQSDFQKLFPLQPTLNSKLIFCSEPLQLLQQQPCDNLTKVSLTHFKLSLDFSAAPGATFENFVDKAACSFDGSARKQKIPAFERGCWPL